MTKPTKINRNQEYVGFKADKKMLKGLDALALVARSSRSFIIRKLLTEALVAHDPRNKI